MPDTKPARLRFETLREQNPDLDLEGVVAMVIANRSAAAIVLDNYLELAPGASYAVPTLPPGYALEGSLRIRTGPGDVLIIVNKVIAN